MLPIAPFQALSRPYPVLVVECVTVRHFPQPSGTRTTQSVKEGPDTVVVGTQPLLTPFRINALSKCTPLVLEQGPWVPVTWPFQPTKPIPYICQPQVSFPPPTSPRRRRVGT